MGAPQVPNLLPMKLKTRVTLSYPTHKVTRFNQQNEKSTSNYTTRVWVTGTALV